MKKLLFILIISFLFACIVSFLGCRKESIVTGTQQVPSNLAINTSVGVKLQTAFVSGDVSMNVKTETSQTVTIKIFNIANTVVSKSTATVKAGDNFLTLYTSAFPSSAYRVGVYDANNNLIAITDFNKL